ncbi:MAG TPA: DUF2911 domain-containing protein [Saprospiraceae bacterium]|nr:DUF2911 domain-containing protein [Saprospiraceae bacterium]
MKMNFFSLLCIAGLSLVVSVANAQTDKSTRPSPPVEIKDKIQGASVAINYSAPSVKGRTIWGDLVPYGKVWRTGANEATTFETDKDIMIQGQKLPAGKYALFTIPGETEWTWIFNSVWDQWGAYKYDESKDVLRVKAVPQKSPVFNEQFRIDIADEKVTLSWENLQVSL